MNSHMWLLQFQMSRKPVTECEEGFLVVFNVDHGREVEQIPGRVRGNRFEYTGNDPEWFIIPGDPSTKPTWDATRGIETSPNLIDILGMGGKAHVCLGIVESVWDVPLTLPSRVFQSLIQLQEEFHFEIRQRARSRPVRFDVGELS